MIKRFLLFTILAIVGAIPLSAQIDAIQGHCTLGGTKAITSGINSTNYNQGIIPGCAVTVYLTGTTTLATIYSNSLGTPLANPFTAVQLPSPNAGYWIFYAPDGTGVDVKLSGGNGNAGCTTAPNCYVTPLTYTDLKVGGGGGGSGVTTVSCNDPNPIYGCNVTNPSTTPNLSFPLKNQNATTVFGNFNATTGPPFFANYTCTGLITCNFNSGTNTINFNVPTPSSLSITATSPILVNGGAGPVASGTANISCPTCGSGGSSIDMQPQGLPAGQHVLLYPNGVTLNLNNDRNTVGADGITVTAFSVVPETRVCSSVTWQNVGVCPSGFITNRQYGPSGFPPALGTLTWTFTGARALEYPTLNPANITSIVGFTKSGNSGTITKQVTCGSGVMNVTGGTILYDQNVAAGGTNPDILQCAAQISDSLAQPFNEELSVGLVGLAIYYTGAPVPPVDANIAVAPPLTLINNVLGVDPAFPQHVNGLTSAALTAGFSYGDYSNSVFLVNDFTSSTTAGVCAGGGTNKAWAVGNGLQWTCYPIAGGGGSSIGTYFTEVVSCTSTCTLSHTPIEFNNLTDNGLTFVYGTDFTVSGTTITLTVPAVGGDVYYAQYRY